MATDAHIKRENGKFPKFFHQFSNSDLFIDVCTRFALLFTEMQTGVERLCDIDKFYMSFLQKNKEKTKLCNFHTAPHIKSTKT